MSPNGLPRSAAPRIVRYSSASRVNSTPPCPPVEWCLPHIVEKVATVPKLPSGAPPMDAPCACAQSSISGTPWRSARRATASIRAGSPAMWATTMALVRGPITASICSGPQLKESGSVSATTGMQPSSGTGIMPPGSLIAGTTTSVNGSTPSARSATYRAAVPELTASA